MAKTALRLASVVFLGLGLVVLGYPIGSVAGVANQSLEELPELPGVEVVDETHVMAALFESGDFVFATRTYVGADVEAVEDALADEGFIAWRGAGPGSRDWFLECCGEYDAIVARFADVDGDSTLVGATVAMTATDADIVSTWPVASLLGLSMLLVAVVLWRWPVRRRMETDASDIDEDALVSDYADPEFDLGTPGPETGGTSRVLALVLVGTAVFFVGAVLAAVLAFLFAAGGGETVVAEPIPTPTTGTPEIPATSQPADTTTTGAAVATTQVEDVEKSPPDAAVCADTGTSLGEGDCEALGALVASQTGSEWAGALAWAGGDDPCTWDGIGCQGGAVVWIDLADRGLSGEIPAEIGNFSNLEDLWLWKNELSGAIPPEIGNLTQLERIDVSESGLSGEIPSEFGNLTNLTGLWLWSNELTGEIPVELANLTNLTELLLDDNVLTGEIPPELGNLANLEVLELDQNRLVGEIPVELGNLTNLTQLALRENQLTGTIPVELGRLTNLTELSIWGNGLSGEIPAELGNLTNLLYLYISQNDLSGPIPVEFGNFSNLKELSLGQNDGLTGGVPAELGNLTNLEVLEIDLNALSGQIPPELGNLVNLTVLDLSEIGLTGEIPPELGNLVNLEELDLSYNELSGEIPEELGNLTNLAGLWLTGNQLSGALPGNLVDVETLYVDEANR